MLLSYEMFWLLIILSICVGISILVAIYWYFKKKMLPTATLKETILLSSVVNPNEMEKRSWTATLKEYEIECPFDFEWKFTKANLILATRDSDDGYLPGKFFYAFNIPGLMCHLKIHPNGDNVNRRGHTVIFLYVTASMERKIAAEFKFSIESVNFTQNAIKVFEEYEGWGTTICKTAEFFDWKNKYFLDEEITIRVKGILKAQRPSVSKISSPISLKWKIKEDDLKEMMKPESSGGLKSKVFNIHSFFHVRYWLVMNTKVLDDQKHASLCLFLYLAFGFEDTIETFIDFSFDSVDCNNAFKPVYENGFGCGRPLCPTEDLLNPSKRYIVDGYLTVNLNGILIGKRNLRMTMKCKNGLPQIQDAKDFMIVIGDKTIQVHKQILMDASPVWAGMIESGMKESAENKMVIKDFPFRIIEAAVKVFYNENGLCILSIEEMFLLHKFAANYCIVFLLDHVEQALVKLISTSNVCQLIQLSAPESCNVPKLHESCVKFLKKCFLKTIPIFAAESLDEKFLASIFLRGLHPMTETFVGERNLCMTMKSKNGLPQIQGPKDFVIVIGDKEIPVHKQRLMDVSPVWARMAGSGMKESVENKIVIEDFSFKVVAAAIKVFYNENGFCSLTIEEMFTLYKFADKYFIESLLDHVEQALVKIISASNVCQLVKLSALNSFNVPKLYESCILFLTKCFKESTPVFGAESLGEKFCASVFLRGFHPVSDLVTHL